MNYVFISAAALIIILYSPYFLAILAGRPERFEKMLLTEMVSYTAERSRDHLWRFFLILLLPTTLMEAGYFGLTVAVFDSTIFLGISLGFALFELFHLVRYVWLFRRYQRGTLEIGELLDWQMERMSCLLFVGHALAGTLILLIL
ncbi:MAG: hypothetical protein ACM3QZ_11710 [Solirubrobacterales bacterium]